MPKKIPSSETIGTYTEKTSTGIFGIITGVLMLLLSVIVLTTNEIININSDSVVDGSRNWIMRLTGFFLIYFGLKSMTYIISIGLSVFPFLKSAFAFISSLVILLISLISTLILIALPWVFVSPKVAAIILIPAVLLWIQMRRLKAQKKAIYEAEFKATGDGKFSEADRIIEATYVDLEEKVNKNKERVKKVVNKLK